MCPATIIIVATVPGDSTMHLPTSERRFEIERDTRETLPREDERRRSSFPPSPSPIDGGGRCILRRPPSISIDVYLNRTLTALAGIVRADCYRFNLT